MAAVAYGHSIPSAQRANLVRTTRKLGMLLGETPRVLEPSDDIDSIHGHHGHSDSVSSTSSTESKRSGRVFAKAPSSRGATLAAISVPPPSVVSEADRPLLYIRLPPGQAPRSRPYSVASPLSPTFSAYTEPMTPLSPHAFAERDRRKKMAKLVRTLGSNVPPELVVAAPAPARSKYIPSPHVVPAILTSLAPAHARQPRRMSVDSFASPTREALSGFPTDSRPSSRTSSNESGWASGSSSGSSVPSSPMRSPKPHYLKVARPGWNASADNLQAHDGEYRQYGTRDARFLSRHIEFCGPSLDLERAPLSASVYEGGGHPQKPSTYRREMGWSGEWSGAGGMEDVVSRLRDLKTK